MPERKHDYGMNTLAMGRLRARVNLQFDMFCDHFGLPPITEEDIDKVLAEEGITPPVKSPSTRDGQLSTGDPSIHGRPHINPPSRKEM